jgi:hypothetical protein
MTYLTTPTNARDRILQLDQVFENRFVSSAKSVVVSSNSQVFTYDNTGTLSPATQYISFNASKANTANNITWTTVPSGINLYSTSTGGSSLTGTATASNIVYLRSADFISTAVFTGSIASSLLSITAVTSGTISIGMTITGGTIPAGCVITALGDGTGGTGTYTVTILAATTIGSITITGTKPPNSIQVTATIIDSEIVSDTTTILKLQAGFGGISAILSNESHTIPTDSTGANPVLVGSGTNIYLYEGLIQLAYDGVGKAAGTWTVSVANADGNVTLGAISDLGTYAQAAALTGMLTSSNTAVITYTITGTSSTGIPIGANSSLIKTQTISKTKQGITSNSIYTGVVYIQNALYPIGTPPTAPTGGTYNFSTPTLVAPTNWTITQPATSTIPTWACEFTFVGTGTVTAGTWSNVHVEAVNGIDGEYRDVIELYSQSTSTKPTTAYYNFTNNTISSSTSSVVAITGWSMTQPASSTSATYMTTCLAKTSTPSTNVTLTAWTDAVVVAQNGAKGNPGDSVTGATGAQVFIIYIRTESSSTVPTVGATSNIGAVPSGGAGSGATTTVWQYTAISPVNLSGSQAQWQSDGTAPAGSNTVTWSTPYLSYFKVGSLAAITANIGNLTVGSGTAAGSISGGKTSYGDTTNAGFFLGYDSATGTPAYKFSIGNSSTGLTWTGSVLNIGTTTAAQLVANSDAAATAAVNASNAAGVATTAASSASNAAGVATTAASSASNAAGTANTAAGTATTAAGVANTAAAAATTAAGLATTAASVANSAAQSKLSKTVDDTLSAVVGFSSTGAIKVGSPATNGAATSNGFFISADGIVATKAGVATLSISGTGDASFKGTISATGGFYGGDYLPQYGYNWPYANGENNLAGKGFALNSSGLLLGNYFAHAANPTGPIGYVEITQNGTFNAPGLNIANGNAIFTGALSAATGSFKGSVMVGTAEISGTGISGAGAAIYNTGSFAMGGSTSSIVGSGSAIYLNGTVISTDNIVSAAVTTSAIYTDPTGITVSGIA